MLFTSTYSEATFKERNKDEIYFLEHKNENIE